MTAYQGEEFYRYWNMRPVEGLQEMEVGLTEALAQRRAFAEQHNAFAWRSYFSSQVLVELTVSDFNI